MSLAPGKDEVHIRQVLDMRTEQRFDVLLRIPAYLLKLIESDDTRTVGLFQTSKDFAQCVFRTENVPQLNAESWHIASSIETELGIQRPQALHECPQHFLAIRTQGIENLLTKNVGKLGQTAGVQDVYTKGIINLVQLWLVITELNQFRLAHTAWRHQTNVVAIRQGTYHLLTFRLSVTKIRFGDSPGYNKRVLHTLAFIDAQI